MTFSVIGGAAPPTCLVIAIAHTRPLAIWRPNARFSKARIGGLADPQAKMAIPRFRTTAVLNLLRNWAIPRPR